MNRTQKKCLIVSLVTHGLLLLLLIVGPAFVPSKPPSNDLPLLDVIPATLVDDAISGGGTPAPVTPTPAPAAPTPAPPVAAPVVQQEPVQPKAAPPEIKTAKPPKSEPEEQEEEPAPEPEPVKNVVKKTPDPDAIPLEPPKKARKQVVLNLKKTVTRKVGGKSHGDDEKAREEAEAKAAAKAYAAAQARRQAAISGVVSDIRGGLSGTVKIEGIGDGAGGGMGGGAAAANYAQAIRSIYDKAWYDPPDEVTDTSLNVEVKIHIARSGQVISARVTGTSGNSALDRSVRRALDRVQSVPPFPAGATDLDRTYTIIFNLKSKRPLG